MWNRGWDLPEDERKKTQAGRVKASLFGCYAPREPFVMEKVLNFLEHEKKYPLGLVHKILDRLAGITVATTVFTYDEIVRYVKELPEEFSIAKGPCACRIHTAETLGPDARDLPSGNLDFCRQTPLDVDIQIATSGEIFGELDTYTLISKEELLELERQCFERGLVSNVYTAMNTETGICHCSSATCAPFLANEALGGASNVIVRGALVAHTDLDACNVTGDCVKVCHFHARRIEEGDGGRQLKVDLAKCYGCGLCAAVCPEQAITMVARRKT